jgi:uncharacterized protein DUF4410
MTSQACNGAQGHLPRTFTAKSSAYAATLGKGMPTIVSCLVAIFVFSGCASTKATNGGRLVQEKLPRPGHIWIYDFSATPGDVASDSTLASPGTAPATPPTKEQAALGRQLGTGITAQLVDEIRAMGLPAARPARGTTPQINDIVIRGYLVSIEQGSAGKRMTIGFGSGGSELTTLVEGYQMTAQGLRKLGSGTTRATGSKGPGASLGAAGWLLTGSPVGLIASGGMKVYGEASGSAKIESRAKQTAKEIANQLKIRFQKQGWIN